jgi:hypothetical protein
MTNRGTKTIRARPIFRVSHDARVRRAVIAGLVVLVAAVAGWKLACQGGADDDPAGPGPAGSTAVTTAASQVKAAAVPASLAGRVTRRDDRQPIAGAVVAIVP